MHKTAGITELLQLIHNMPVTINVLKGNFDLKELPLKILNNAPASLTKGEIVIVREGSERWLYWNTEGTIFKAKGTVV